MSCGVPIQQPSSYSAVGKGILREMGLILIRNIAAHVTIIADWELEGLDEAEIARKMKRSKTQASIGQA